MKKLMLLMLLNFSIGLREEDIIEIITELKKHFYSDCVYFLYEEEKGLRSQTSHVRDMKLLVHHGVSTITLRISSIFKPYQSVHHRCNHPLWILPQNVEISKTVLYKLLGNYGFSKVIWFLILNSTVSLEEFFAGINIPFDCEFLVAQPLDDSVVILTEVYRVSPTLPLRTEYFGNWTPLEGLSSPELSLYKRRNNLEGLVLRVGVRQAFMTKITKEENKKPQEIKGYFADIWKLLETRLKFQSDYYKGYEAGIQLPNGSFNGLVGMLLRNEVDIAITNSMFVGQRLSVVDYVGVIYVMKDYIYIRKPEASELVWDSFLMPFSDGIWFTLAAVIVVTTLVLITVEKLWIRLCTNNTASVTILEFLQKLLSIFYVFCNQDDSEPALLVSIRIIHLTIFFTAVVILASYSASLLSHIMTSTPVLPFYTFEEFLQDGSYTLAVLANSAHLTYFKKSNNPVLKKIYHKLIAPHESSLPPHYIPLIANVCIYPKYAIRMIDKVVLEQSAKLNCSLTKVHGTSMKSTWSFIIRKRDPYTGILIHTLHNMLRSGILQALEKRTLPSENLDTQEEIRSVTIIQVAPILVALIAGLSLSILLLIIAKGIQSVKSMHWSIDIE